MTSGRPLRTVSVLCASRTSVYHGMNGVDVYDQARDARTFPGDTPIVAHPPCRAWSAYCSHQAKPAAGERELGLWCCEMLRQCGGILEQPAHSRLFATGGLPLPGEGERDGVLSIAVQQAWWGHPTAKRTWLAIAGVPLDALVIPYRLRNPKGDRRRWQVQSHNQRSATLPAFGDWLVAIARLSRTAERMSA